MGCFLKRYKLLSNSLNGGLIFSGYRDDIPKILGNFKVIIVPSWEEPFGRVTIEAMAAGVPVIGTASGGTKEIIEDGKSGYLVPPRDPGSIAEKLLFLYKNPAIITDMGDYGETYMKMKFSIENYVQEIERIMITFTREFN
jgi:glycosyltransferase involved in cell wall biosynthesis